MEDSMQHVKGWAIFTLRQYRLALTKASLSSAVVVPNVTRRSDVVSCLAFSSSPLVLLDTAGDVLTVVTSR